MIEFTRLADREQDEYVEWVDHHPAGSLFHSLPWLDFVCREHGGVRHLYRVECAGTLCGYWPTITVEKGPFRLLGSPLRGWLTTKMGPLLDRPAGADHVSALARLCMRDRIAYQEMAGDLLGEDVMRPLGYSVRVRETWLLPLCRREADQWERLDHSCRKNIKKAERSHVEVREVDVDDPSLTRLYPLVAATYKEKGLAVPYGPGRIELLRDTVGRAGRLLCLAAFHDGEFAGGHIWGHDRRCAYAFVAASQADLKPLRISNLLLWEGIRRFIRMGLQTYDMYGGGQGNEGVARFKKSFGAVHHTAPHFALSHSRTFSILLHLYEKRYLHWRRYPSHL